MHERVEQFFSLQRQADLVLQLYRALLGPGAPKP